MSQGEEFFKPWEGEVFDWASAQSEIGNLLSLAADKRRLAWRGVPNAAYSLHSSLYRRVLDVTGAPPEEDELVELEKRMLERARRQWRYDDKPALEVLAHMQHFGGPTRLIDVSFNPLIALWFAVEEKHDEKGVAKPQADGRIVVFDVTDREIDLKDEWGEHDPPWHNRPIEAWRTGLPKIWRPPSYNDRIPAQNSAFLLGGVPTVSSHTAAKYRKSPGIGTTMGTWSADEVRRSTSVTTFMQQLGRKPIASSKPTYTLRVHERGKREIRDQLERNFGYNVASIYPDLFGLAGNIANGLIPSRETAQPQGRN